MLSCLIVLINSILVSFYIICPVLGNNTPPLPPRTLHFYKRPSGPLECECVPLPAKRSPLPPSEYTRTLLYGLRAALSLLLYVNNGTSTRLLLLTLCRALSLARLNLPTKRKRKRRGSESDFSENDDGSGKKKKKQVEDDDDDPNKRRSGRNQGSRKKYIDELDLDLSDDDEPAPAANGPESDKPNMVYVVSKL